MANSTRVSNEELSQMRRSIAQDQTIYTDLVRLIASGKIETGDFLASEKVRYHNKLAQMLFNTPEKFKTTSREGYFIGRDFLTNQPIFKKY